jgi:hypothetical protein
MPPGAGGTGALGPPGGAGATATDITTMPVAAQVEEAVTKLRKARERLLIKAEATSWALCYYLARERPREFRKFLDDLAMLPRDLPLDGAVVTQTFMKAFNLDGSNDSLRRFSEGWLKYMNDQVRVSEDIELIEPKKGGTSPLGPGGGMNPGGTGT